MWRRLFEEHLMAALRSVAEANEISKALDTGASFTVRLTSDLPESRVLTLAHQDLLPYNELSIIITCQVPVHSSSTSSSSSSSSAPSEELGGEILPWEARSGRAGDKGETCELFAVLAEDFVDVLEALKDSYERLQVLSTAAKATPQPAD